MQDLGKEKYSFAYVVPRMLKDENAPVWKKVQRRWRSKKIFLGKMEHCCTFNLTIRLKFKLRFREGELTGESHEKYNKYSKVFHS